MKKTLALLALTAALAAPMAAQAHRAWIAPTSTVLSGNDAWVGFDAGMSNVVFQPDHAAMRFSDLQIIAPDGSKLEAKNSATGRYRSMFDIELKQEGTYRVADVAQGFMAMYEQGGERKRFRGSEADFATAIPADATNVQASRTFTRTETFVTLGNPNETALAPTGQGLELVPVSHPNDAAEGEASTFKLLLNGQPAANVDVTIAREGQRYRTATEEVATKTAADGTFSVTWAASGLHWIGASVRTDGANGQPGTNASYNGTIEVLP